MRKFLSLFIIIPFLLQAQEKGIQFQHELSWQQAQAKAKTENKYIFMDCFTTWCGPCRFMSTQVFTTDTVANIMNKDFICVKVQLDTTANDNSIVKSWYKDGHNIAAIYKVNVYPTYLFFSPDGKLVHRAVGSSMADVFLTKAKNALNPETQYYTLLAEYNTGKNDSAFLRNLTRASLDAYDNDNTGKVADAYLKTQSNLYTKTNLELLQDLLANGIYKSGSTGFNIFYKNPERIDSVLGTGVAESITQSIIMGEFVYSKFPKTPIEKPDWSAINTSLNKSFPSVADQLTLKAKVIWYQYVKDWDNYKSSVMSYMNTYGGNASPNDLNDYAWTIFQNCNDMTCVATALDWSKKSFTDNNNPAFMDTYANILYKLGKKDDALMWEQKAMNAALESDKKGYQETIDKMKNGEKTWN